jgi:TRAP-type mannitol/chloroaromatic compound transport system permease small subunit
LVFRFPRVAGHVIDHAPQVVYTAGRRSGHARTTTMTKSSLITLLTRVTTRIDHFNDLLGRMVSWLVIAMVLLVSYDVTMRYVFSSGSVALQELEWHLFSIIFLLGAAFTLRHDDHVRLDLFYHSRFMNDYRRAWVNLIGSLCCLIPFCLLVIISSLPFVQQSFLHLESSPDPGGLPYRWLLKSAIPLGFALLVLQGISEAAKSLRRILEGSP